MRKNHELEQLHSRLRSIREARRLTLRQASLLSKGSITAIALGSYERGDRSVSAEKLLIIASMYGVPVSELFAEPDKGVTNARLTIDLRKLKVSTGHAPQRVLTVLENIARLRSDWNGEVISLRHEDLTHLSIFTNLQSSEIEKIQEEFAVSRSK